MSETRGAGDRETRSGTRGTATVLVTEADRKQSLACIRALGRRGHEVIAASHDPRAQGFYSKYTSETVLTEDLHYDDEAAFVADIQRAVDRYDVDVLLPTDHFSTLTLARTRERYPDDVAIPLVDYETMLTAEDKQRLLAVADEAGVPTPSTHRPTSWDEFETVVDAVEYPVVVKYTQGTGSLGIQYADSPAELREVYEPDAPSSLHVEREWPLIQEYVPGDTHDATMLFADGEPRAAFTGHRVSTYPRSGGWSVVAESTDEPDLLEHATRLFEHLEWHGIGQAEFKRDERTGEPVLIEVNPRINGKIEVPIRAGVDFPNLLVELALTGDVDSPDGYDTDWRIVYIDEVLALRLWHEPGRLRYLGFLGQVFAGGTHTSIDLGDPAPHAVRWAQLGWRAAPNTLTDRLGGIASLVPGSTGAGHG